MPETFYYVDATNQRIGPLDWQVIEQLHQAGVITDETLLAGESDSEWVPYVDLRFTSGPSGNAAAVTSPRERDAGPGFPSGSSSARKRPSKPKMGKVKRIVLIILVTYLAFCLLLIAIFVSPLADHRIFHMRAPWVKTYHPQKMPLTEIAEVVETMPQAWHPVPDESRRNKGFMTLVTGEGSVQVREIPDHPGLYQIDVTRYGVIYDRLPEGPGTRNARTTVLSLGTEFKDGWWRLVDAKGGSVDEISKPGQGLPDRQTTESIPLGEAMWQGQWVIDHLNLSSLDEAEQKKNEAEFLELEASFLAEEAKIHAIRAQGIEVPR